MDTGKGLKLMQICYPGLILFACHSLSNVRSWALQQISSIPAIHREQLGPLMPMIACIFNRIRRHLNMKTMTCDDFGRSSLSAECYDALWVALAAIMGKISSGLIDLTRLPWRFIELRFT
jgi:hypothetical protein